MPATPQQKRLWRAFACGFALLTFGVGFLGGFFAAKHVGTHYLTLCSSHAAHDDANEAPGTALQPTTAFSRGMPTSGLALREMDPPWSEEAMRLRSRPGASGTQARLYTLHSDADSITEEITEGFLRQLQNHLAENGHQIAASGINMTETLDEFASVAKDILSYLRHKHSRVILLLLRQYSERGSIAIADADPDELQQEVRRLLNVTALGDWYAVASQTDHGAITTIPWTQALEGTSQLLTDASQSRNPANNNNRRRRLLLRSAHAAGHRRHLHAAAAAAPAAPAPAARRPTGAPIPVIPKEEARVERVPPTVSPLMTLQEMLCSVKSYSPSGLKGMMLPDRKTNGTGKGRAIVCPPVPEPAIFRYKQLVFKPVKIPVVFHCQRFMMGNVLHPPMWDAVEAARNLVNVTNKLMNRTFIELELQEVRTDVKKYPYLLLGSLEDWQRCSGTPSQEAAGFPCLAETASDPAFAALTKKHVVNIIVGGSQMKPYCNGTEEEECSQLYAGYTGSIGPWFARPSATWNEDSVRENWIYMNWDQFSPMIRNSWRFWDGGANTLAHELGHYMGLMHTHEGASPCEGDGLNKADAVPDTPVNLQTADWAAKNNLMVKLARWCGEFRTGKNPQPNVLLSFNSCQQDLLAIDNVFNLLSYLPDMCCMLLTPNQIARLQWAVARFRPKMMAAYAVE